MSATTPNSTAAPSSAAASNAGQKGRCQACGDAAPMTATICGGCGTRLAWAVAAVPAAKQSRFVKAAAPAVPAPGQPGGVTFLAEEKKTWWERVDGVGWLLTLGGALAVSAALFFIFARATGMGGMKFLAGVPLIFVVRFILNQIFD